MADRVRMKSKTVFQNDRVTVFHAGGPKEGEPGRTVTVGDEFETDVFHGKELARLGHAEPLGWSVDGLEDPALEPHHQVSMTQLQLDQQKRGHKKVVGAAPAAVAGNAPAVATPGVAAAAPATAAPGAGPHPAAVSK